MHRLFTLFDSFCGSVAGLLGNRCTQPTVAVRGGPTGSDTPCGPVSPVATLVLFPEGPFRPCAWQHQNMASLDPHDGAPPPPTGFHGSLAAGPLATLKQRAAERATRLRSDDRAHIPATFGSSSRNHGAMAMATGDSTHVDPRGTSTPRVAPQLESDRLARLRAEAESRAGSGRVGGSARTTLPRSGPRVVSAASPIHGAATLPNQPHHPSPLDAEYLARLRAEAAHRSGVHTPSNHDLRTAHLEPPTHLSPRNDPCEGSVAPTHGAGLADGAGTLQNEGAETVRWTSAMTEMWQSAHGVSFAPPEPTLLSQAPTPLHSDPLDAAGSRQTGNAEAAALQPALAQEKGLQISTDQANDNSHRPAGIEVYVSKLEALLAEQSKLLRGLEAECGHTGSVVTDNDRPITEEAPPPALPLTPTRAPIHPRLTALGGRPTSDAGSQSHGDNLTARAEDGHTSGHADDTVDLLRTEVVKLTAERDEAVRREREALAGWHAATVEAERLRGTTVDTHGRWLSGNAADLNALSISKAEELQEAIAQLQRDYAERDAQREQRFAERVAQVEWEASQHRSRKLLEAQNRELAGAAAEGARVAAGAHRDLEQLGQRLRAAVGAAHSPRVPATPIDHE